jgi:molybdate-binding protein
MEGSVFVAAVVEGGVVNIVVGMSGFTVYAERDFVVISSEDFNILVRREENVSFQLNT